MDNITGSPVEGNNFFGREKELEFAWEHLKKGNSMILPAPRRVGKSSFAKKLLAKAAEENWNSLELNLEQVASEEAFIRLLIEKLTNQSWWEGVKKKYGEKAERILTSIKPSIEYEGIKGTIEWQKRKENIYEELKSLLGHAEPPLIMVDEVTIYLNNCLHDKEHGQQNISFFLNWLRSFRQVSNTKIRWIFCSSIGIDNFTNTHQLSHTFNDVPPFPLGAFDKPTSSQLLKNLAKSDNLTISDKDINYMLEKLGWWLPYFLQILHYKINYLVKIQDFPINKSTIDTAYEQLSSENHLNIWDERLTDFGEYESYARKVLNHLCQTKTGASRGILIEKIQTPTTDSEAAELLTAKLLNMLQNDGYLIENQQKYLFRSPLLRDFWFNRFIK